MNLVRGTRGKDGKERILSAALGLFAESGFDRVSIRDVAAAAELTNPALYRHYAGKEELGRDLYRRCYRQMVHALEAAACRIERPLDRLAGYPAAIAGLYERKPTVMLYVDEHQVRFWPQLREEFEPRTLSRIVETWVREGRADGSVRTDVDVAALVAVPLGLTSQWAAMRSAEIASASAAAGLEKLVRSALSSPVREVV